MSRRATPLGPPTHDGTPQAGRALAALDPATAPIEGRGPAELLRLVQALAAQLRYYEAVDGALKESGSWWAFANHAELDAEAIAAHLAHPERETGARGDWLRRPHFALLLVFIELLQRARGQLNQLTERHLAHYYQDVLQMRPLPPEPDQVALLLRLATGAPPTRLPSGTALRAGRDADGVERLYETTSDLLITRAQVEALRSVFVDRRIVGVPQAREDLSLTAALALDETLKIALGEPAPGDPVPTFEGQAVDTGFLRGLAPLWAFPREQLHLEPHELRDLARELARREGEDAEWVEIVRLLSLNGGDPDALIAALGGASAPSKPEHVQAMLEVRVGPLNFREDGLPFVDDLDDLYHLRGDPEVHAYIDERMAPIGEDTFYAVMRLKHQADASWALIRRLLERAGRRSRGQPAWRLATDSPRDFEANLTLALGAPPPWPQGLDTVQALFAHVEAIERHLGAPMEGVQRLIELAEAVGDSADATAFDWSAVDEVLIDAHAERDRLRAQDRIQAAVGEAQGLAALEAAASFALQEGEPEEDIPWDEARQALATPPRPGAPPPLDAGQLAVLDGYRAQLLEDWQPRRFTWADALAALEQAWRRLEERPAPRAEKVEWRNLYAYDDATMRISEDASSTRWRTFGGLPEADPALPPAPNMGFAIRSTMLRLSEGQRTLTLTLGLSPVGFDLDALRRALGVDPSDEAAPTLLEALAARLQVELSGAEAPVLPTLEAAALVSGQGEDYWSLTGLPRRGSEDSPALQLTLTLPPTADPVVAPEGQRAPELRLWLRPLWDADRERWRTGAQGLDALVVDAVHIAVDVEGLQGLRLQLGGQDIDPAEPWMPFGGLPLVGTELLLSHPELIQRQLETLRFDLEWMGLPPSLPAHYLNYKTEDDQEALTSAHFKARLSLVERGAALKLGDRALFGAFEGTDPEQTSAHRSMTVARVDEALRDNAPGFSYRRLPWAEPGEDLRRDPRALRWELTPEDFGHNEYAGLVAAKAREMSAAMSGGAKLTATQAAAYQVNPPYTPQLKSLSVAYTSSLELRPQDWGVDDAVLHLHPFGEAAVHPERRHLLPRYARAGELYIGLSGVAGAEPLSLLLQLAEGTSDPDVAPPEVRWSILDGGDWRPLVVREDGTRGLLNSGVVRLDLPAVAAPRRLPAGLTWLRVAIDRDAESVCDCVNIHAQAVTARLSGAGHGARHYETPLPPGSVERLVEPDARVAGVGQPYTSLGGRPPESPERFRVRVSEQLRHKERALALWDYERLALQRFPQLYKAKCLPVSDEGLVDLIVVPDIRDALPGEALAPKAPANLLEDIRAYLQARAPAAARVRVRNARYVPVRVRVGVRLREGVDEAFAKRQLAEDLMRYLAPWAYERGAELMIGGRIYATHIINFVDRLDYIDYVAELRLFRGREPRMVPFTDDYHVAAESPDEVLVAAREHDVDVLSEQGFDLSSLIGLNHMKIQLDFVVG